MPDSQGHQHHGITKMEGKRTIDDDDDDDDDDPSYQGNRVPDSIKVMNTMSSKTNNFGQKNEHSDQKSTRMCLFSRFFGEFWGGGLVSECVFFEQKLRAKQKSHSI